MGSSASFLQTNADLEGMSSVGVVGTLGMSGDVAPFSCSKDYHEGYLALT